jgi:Transposase DDE domain
VLVGDKGYTDAELEDRLWRTRRILLLPLRRRNEARQWDDDIPKLLGRIRHGVETVFSTMSTVFNVEHPRGRSLVGHVVRVATIILAHTLSFFMA